jgi:outer membrane protein assembly factor BamB
MFKHFISLLFFFSSFNYSQTLIETVNLPSGTYWNSAYGMVYNNSKYWISSYSSQVDVGILKAVDSTGTQVDQLSINYPTIEPSQGLTNDGINFWYIERYGGGDFFNVAPDGTVLDSIISTQLFGGSWYIGGAGWDGTNLWISVYHPNPDAALYKINVNTKTIVDTIPTYGTQPQGITFKGDTLFYVMDDNENDDERVFAVDLATKDTLFSFHVPDQSSQSPRGLAWDGTYFWLLAEPVGGTGRQLFKYDLEGSGTPGIFVPVTTIVFPNTTVGTDTSVILQIFNNGTAPLVVDSANTTGNNFYVTGASFPLQINPGGSDNIAVHFSPQNYFFYQEDLNIYSNDPVDPVVQVNLFGQGVLNGAKIGLSASTHNFGSVWVGEGITYWDFQIFNMGDQTLDVFDMQLSVPEFSYEAPSLPFQIFSTDTVDIRIYFYPTQIGRYEDTLKITTNDLTIPVAKVSLLGTGVFNQYNYGYAFWQYQVPLNPYGGNSWRWIEGLKPINDITGDGVSEVILATENGWTMCIDGAASGSSFPIWTFNTHINNNNSGSIGANGEYGVQDAIQIANDLNTDGFSDVVLAFGGGNEHVYVLDGTNGEIIWKYGDEINYGLGDFEAADVQRDFNGDNIEDVLAIADGNSGGTGYKRAFLFNGTDGSIIWQHFYPGPNPAFGKTIISVDDFTGDNIPEAIIAYGNNGSTNQSVRALNGSNGNEIWTRNMIELEPKELLALPLPGGGTDIIAAEYRNRIHRLNGTNGNIVWTYPLGSSASVVQIGIIEDIDNDQVPDILVASFAGNGFNCLSGGSGTQLWSYQMQFQFGVAAVPDLDDDGFEDVVVGCQDQSLYCINGKGDSLIFRNQFTDRVYAVNVMPSIDGNYSYEVLSGTRDSKVICLSGGADVITSSETTEEIPTEFVLLQNYPNPFNPSTKIEFKIPVAGLANLKVYDLLGREVTTLLNKVLQPGNYAIDFDASTLSSGIYFYALRAGTFISTKKMILLK